MAYTGPKKFSKKVKTKTGTKTVRYGAKGYSISPGTKKGDSYCARSAGQMKKNPKAAKTQTAHCVCPERNGNAAARNRGESDMETCKSCRTKTKCRKAAAKCMKRAKKGTY